MPDFARSPGKPRDGLLARIGDTPLRAVYTVAAVIATIAAVVLVFTVFAEETPRSTAPGGAAPSADPVAELRLPAPPRSKALPELPGTAAPVTGLVVDEKSGLVYARLGEPWTRVTAAPFTAAQRVGAARAPRTLIASAPMPGEVPADLRSGAQYRALAARAARWTLRYQPTPTKVTWTGSQPLERGRGWVLGYRVDYEVNGESRTSQAVVVVADTGREKPALLFATVPDTRKARYRDLNTVVSSIRPSAGSASADPSP